MRPIHAAAYLIRLLLVYYLKFYKYLQIYPPILLTVTRAITNLELELRLILFI